MLTVSKRKGATSTAGTKAKKGNQGRLELVAESSGDGFNIRFTDFGNYGKIRWVGDFGELSNEDLADMISKLEALLQGQTTTTQVDFETPTLETQGESEAESAEPIAVEPEVSFDEDPEIERLEA